MKYNILNIILFIIYIPIFIIDFKSNGLIGSSIAIFIYLFALIEQINYFYIRLSYYGKIRATLSITRPVKLIISGKAQKSKLALAKEIASYKGKIEVNKSF